MFNDSINFLVQSIEKSQVYQQNNVKYQKFHNFFPENLLDKLVKLNDVDFKTENLEKQEKFPRKRLDYNEMISKELNIIFRHSKITKALGEKYDCSLKMQTADVWFDTEGYTLTPHIDDSRIKLAIQIYLGEDDQPGTALFETEKSTDPYEVFPYKPNYGYALKNTSQSFHGTVGAVTKGLRKSVYIRYAD